MTSPPASEPIDGAPGSPGVRRVVADDSGDDTDAGTADDADAVSGDCADPVSHDGADAVSGDATDARTGDGTADDRRHVHLFMEQSENRRLLAEWLEAGYDVSRGALDGAAGRDVDLCIADWASYARDRAALTGLQDAAAPVFLPVLLVVPARPEFSVPGDVWQDVDDVVEAPIRKAELGARLAALLEQRRTSRELAERERALELRTALLEAQSEATIDGLLVVDDERRVVHSNDRFRELWALDRAAVVRGAPDPLGREHLVDQVADADRFEATVESLYDRPDGEDRDEFQLVGGRWIDLYSAPVTGESGLTYGRLWVSRDVTERKEYERELEAHRDRLEAFASTVSHDLRNPLTVAKGFLEHAIESEDAEPEALETVARAHDRMQTLIDDLLLLTRSNRAITSREPVWLAPLVERCWQNVETDRAELRVETELELMADRTRLEQLVENLVRNAIEHGGRDVTVTVGDCPSGFFVEDTGPGIPGDQCAAVFDSGFSTDEDGTGFGLSIVQQIVDAHGWSVAIAAGSEGGARFEITGVTE